MLIFFLIGQNAVFKSRPIYHYMLGKTFEEKNGGHRGYLRNKQYRV